MKHIPFDREAKAKKVEKGTIRQSIRLYDEEIKEGTKLLLRAWEGTPYQSKWAFQRRERVKEAIPCRLYPEDAPKTRIGWIVKLKENGEKEFMSSMEMWDTAIRDDHPTLTSLYDRLRECYEEKVYTEKFLIVRW